MAFCSSLDIVGSALTAERFHTDIILQNIANQKSTAVDSTGEPYRRKQVIFQERALTFDQELQKAKGGVRAAQVVESQRDFKPVYDPTHPQANEEGYVLYPNVDSTEEMLDLMSAINVYETNLTAMSVLKSMISKTMEMNR